MHCSRFISQDLRAYLETATKKPTNHHWEVEGADEEMLQRGNKIEIGLSQWNTDGSAEGSASMDRDAARR